MAVVTYHYVGEYPLAFESNPNLYDILYGQQTELVGSISPTSALYQLTNGLMVRLLGTGFTADDEGDIAYTGTMTGFQILLEDGSTVLLDISLNLSMESFYDASLALNPNDLAGFLLNRSDTINGSDVDDDIRGFAGDDIINAGAGDSDFVDGGEGKDTYDGGIGAFDQLSFASSYGSTNAYRGIVLNAVDGTVIDPWGNSETFINFESFRGSQFADSMTGSDLDEDFMGLGGRDLIDGGAGFDIARYHRDADRGGMNGVVVNLLTNTAVDGFGRTDTLLSIEGVRGTRFADSFVGNGADNVFRGDDGNDVFDGRGGLDSLDGGAGNDTYILGAENDTVQDSSGVDTITSTITRSLTDYSAIENLTLLGTAAINATGDSSANILTGSTGSNVLNGRVGADIMRGLAGNDTYVVDNAGDLVDESIAGSNGLDTILSAIGLSLADTTKVKGTIENLTLLGTGNINAVGNAAANALTSNIGKNTLIGGGGDDNFIFNTALNSVSNVDTIKDMNQSGNDTIRLEKAIFTTLLAGTLSAGAFRIGTAAADADDRIIYNSANGQLSYDSNGNLAGGSTLFAVLNPGLALTAGDFFVI